MKRLLTMLVLTAVLSLSAFGQAEPPPPPPNGPGNGSGKVVAQGHTPHPVIVSIALWVSKVIL